MDLTPFHGPPAVAPQVPGFAARTLLGFGAHGEVWRAEDLTSGAEVALKIGRRARPDDAVPDGTAASGSAVAATERETALLCRIEHPHIVRLQRVVPLGEAGLALVLDLASGGSLASLVASRGRFDPGEVSTLIVPLAGALGHLHRSGVTHGDIAPGNVLFTADGRPQLGDLGVARVLGGRSDQAWSTPGFTDPAIVAGGEPFDPRIADVWGLAAIAWFALTGRPPAPDVVVDASADDRAPALTQLLTQCLVADPALRPGLDELADRAWQAAHPVPIRFATEHDQAGPEAGLPPLSSRVTSPAPGSAAALPESARSPEESARSRLGAASRIPAGVVANGDGPAGRLHRVGNRWSALLARFQPEAPRLRVGLAAGAAAVLALCAVVAALLGPLPGHRSRPSGVRSVAAVTSPGSVSSSSTPAVPLAGLDLELGQALNRIASSRANAFALASGIDLIDADQRDSPAYRADQALVRRLRARGYRLTGVRYAVAGVQALARHGDAVDVRAVVTTSSHTQVGATSKVSVPVPQDGPRPVVFTLVALGPATGGPARWRVRSVRAAS